MVMSKDFTDRLDETTFKLPILMRMDLKSATKQGDKLLVQGFGYHFSSFVWESPTFDPLDELVNQNQDILVPCLAKGKGTKNINMDTSIGAPERNSSMATFAFTLGLFCLLQVEQEVT